jgi:nucleoside-diphosphate-sugar epimerase
MRLLVTGAGGMIGSHVARLAADGGHEVHGVFRRAPEATPEGVTVHVADLLDRDAAPTILRRITPTHLIHAAWETGHGTYWNSLDNLAWVEATARLARAFAETGGIRFVEVGSCAEYDWSHGRCIEGETPERPSTRYGLAKLAAWKCVEAAALGSFEAAEARIFFAYGPGENPERIIPHICRSHAAGEIPNLSSGAQLRDLLHVADAAAAILALATADGLTGPVNIGGGEPVRLGEVARWLAQIADAADCGLGRRPDREDDPELLVPHVGRLFATGWRPSLSLEEGLRSAFEHWAGKRPG